jgi:hypothetical protein
MRGRQPRAVDEHEMLVADERVQDSARIERAINGVPRNRVGRLDETWFS